MFGGGAPCGGFSLVVAAAIYIYRRQQQPTKIFPRVRRPKPSSTGATTYSYELTAGFITRITIDDYDDKGVTTLTWE